MCPLTQLYMCFAVMWCFLFDSAATNDPEIPSKGIKRLPKINLKNQCQIIALNLFGVPSPEEWGQGNSCVKACSNKLRRLNEWMSVGQTGEFQVYRGDKQRKKPGPYFKTDSCLVNFRFCVEDFSYPATEAMMIPKLDGSMLSRSGCICQRALVLTQVWEESANVANWQTFNPKIAANKRPSCTVDEICRRVQKGIAYLGWLCSQSSHLIKAEVDCLSDSQDASECPCALSTSFRGRTPCPKGTCPVWPLKFPTYGRPLVQDSDQSICVDINGMTYIAIFGKGRKIPLQRARGLDLGTILSSLQQRQPTVENVDQSANEPEKASYCRIDPYPVPMHSDFAPEGEATSGTAVATSQVPDMSMHIRKHRGQCSERLIDSLNLVANLEQTSSKQLADASDYEQFLVTQDINYLLSTDDRIDNGSDYADWTSFLDMPMQPDYNNLDSLPQLSMHASLEQGHESQRMEMRAGKRPRTEAESNVRARSTVLESSSQLGRLMDGTVSSNTYLTNLDSMPRTHTPLYFSGIAESHSHYGHHHQQDQPRHHSSQEDHTDSLHELDNIFVRLEYHMDENPEGDINQDDPSIL